MDELGDRPALLGELLRAGLPGLRLERAAEAGLLSARWREVVGDAVADHAEPTSLRSGVLRVRADSPMWAAEIGYLREMIRERANALLGDAVVSEVRLWTAPGAPSRRGGHTPRHRRHREPLATAPPEASEGPAAALERARAAWAKRRAQASGAWGPGRHKRDG